MTTTIEPETRTKTDDGTLDHWPPVIHISRIRPARAGDRALCGAKLMGLNLNFNRTTPVTCKRCAEIAQEIDRLGG